MPGPIELAELHHLIGGVRRCAASLKSHYGDIPPMRRIVNDADRLLNDADRLGIDSGELDVVRGAAPEHCADEKIQVPDTEYDIDFWRDADDEGIGGQHGAR